MYESNLFFLIYLFQTAEKEPETGDEPSPFTAAAPPGDACCTESMLGLLNIAPEQDIWQLLRVSSVFTVI